MIALLPHNQRDMVSILVEAVDRHSCCIRAASLLPLYLDRFHLLTMDRTTWWLFFVGRNELLAAAVALIGHA